MALLELKNITAGYDKNIILKDFNISVEKGEFVSLLGSSGCGKTTCLRLIAGFSEPMGGQIIFNGQDITHFDSRQMRDIRKDMQIIFQDPYSSLPPRDTVGGILSEPVEVHKIVPKAEVKQYVLDLMDKCGLRDYYFERYPHEFSGGQRQRICIARALSVNPKLVICDEPVSALDVSIQAQVLNLLMDLQEKMGLTYMFVTHDLSVVRHISDDICVMYLGQLVETCPSKKLFEQPLHPYTKALLSAIPSIDLDRPMRRVELKGEITSAINPKPGCRFAPRCPYACERCYEPQELTEVEEGHFVSCCRVKEIN